jgi:hypothetical protein
MLHHTLQDLVLRLCLLLQGALRAQELVGRPAAPASPDLRSHRAEGARAQRMAREAARASGHFHHITPLETQAMAVGALQPWPS